MCHVGREPSQAEQRELSGISCRSNASASRLLQHFNSFRTVSDPRDGSPQVSSDGILDPGRLRLGRRFPLPWGSAKLGVVPGGLGSVCLSKPYCPHAAVLSTGSVVAQPIERRSRLVVRRRASSCLVSRCRTRLAVRLNLQVPPRSHTLAARSRRGGRLHASGAPANRQRRRKASNFRR